MSKGKKSLSPGQWVIAVIIFQLCQYLTWGLDPQKPIDQYLIDQWEMTDGIPSNTVKAIAQTPDGYLWLGTSRGLVRFDGVKFAILHFDQKEEINAQEIRSLKVDQQGTLWIGSSKNLTSYPYRTGKFKTFTKADGITPEGIRSITDDTQGNLWISFDASYVNSFSGSQFTTFDSSHGLTSKKINTIIEDSQGHLMFGSREDGLFTYKKGRFFKYPVPGLENVMIITMFADREKELWIGSLDCGLFRVTATGTKNYTTKDGLAGNHITCIIQDSDRNLWVGTTKGLNRIRKTPDGTTHFESLLNSASVYCLFEDREKSIWVGTEASGIKRLKDGKFMPYEPFKTDGAEIPFSLFEDWNGDIWIGTEGGKLFLCRGTQLSEVTVPTDIGITAIATDAQGNLWLGTIGNGVFQQQNNRFMPFTTREKLADNVVTSIYKDSRDNLWFSTFDGVSLFHPQNRTIESLKSTAILSGKEVHNVYESKAGDIWIASDKGITILPEEYAAPHLPGNRAPKPNRPKTHWSHKTFFAGISVTSIHEDIESPGVSGSIFWVATQGQGLKRLHIKNNDFTAYSITSYTTAQGLPTNFIYQFLEDLQGNFWLTSDRGILCVNKGELNAMATSSIDKLNCASFGIEDGIRSLEFNNKFSPNSALKTRNGDFMFITKKGITLVNPAKLRVNQTPPPVVIEGLSFNQQFIPLHTDTGPLSFKGIEDIGIYFTAPTFLSPEKTRFKYRLAPVNREWVDLEPGVGRVAHYKKLSPGHYIFSVTACNADGLWNPTGQTVAFTVTPLFYQTLIFELALLFLLAALLGVAFYLYRKRFSEKKIKYKDSPLNPDFTAECIKKLNALMEVEKVYSDADLSLPVLAEKMSLSSHQLSQLLNEKMDRNFFDFINQYRIEAAIKLLQSPRGAQRKISAIAMDVGFNTMAAFYKAFKKHTGKTPSSYQKQATGKK